MSIRLVTWLVVLGQCATLVAAPIAVCCLADPAEMTAHDCPHEMEPGAACPMHAAPSHDTTPSTTAELGTCASDADLLVWLQVPAAPPEPVHRGDSALFAVSQTDRLATPGPLDSLVRPPSPPPRG